MPVAARSWRAVGTSVHVLVTQPEQADLAASVVRAVLDEVDLAYSRFRPDSELSRLNAGDGRPMRLSPLLAQAIGVSLQAAAITGGAVDPTVGRALRTVGYDEDFSLIHDRRETLTLRMTAIPGWRAVRFDAAGGTAELPRGVELDLGSTGKALAADLAAEAAHVAIGAGGVLVSIGGDIATAGDVPSGGWHILAAEDSEAAPDGPGEVIGIHGGAVATSSTTVRRWTRGGAILHHLIDPRTSLPARGPCRTATVLAASCVAANTISTAAIVRGEGALGWLRDLGVPARLVSTTGDVRRLGGWPQPAEVAA